VPVPAQLQAVPQQAVPQRPEQRPERMLRRPVGWAGTPRVVPPEPMFRPVRSATPSAGC
jgi:hypothetical protein